MATEIEELLIRLEADTANFRAEMTAAVASVDKATSQMQKDIQKFSQDSAKNTSFFTQAWATLTGTLGSKAITAALGFLQSAFGQLFSALEAGVDDANRQEDAMARLNQALANTGHYSKDASDAFSTFADQIEATTGIADDAVITVGALIANLAGLSGPALQNATKAAADLSAALGIDFQTAGNLVAKAVNGNVEAFKRYGIAIQEGKTQTETLNNVLEALNGRFGGTAEKLAGTFQGSFNLARAAVGNLNEELSRSIQGNPVIVAAFQAVAKVFGGLTEEAKANKQALRVLVGEGIVAVIEATQVAIGILDALAQEFRQLVVFVSNVPGVFKADFQEIVDIVSTSFQAIKAAASGDFEEALLLMEQGVTHAGDTVGEFNRKVAAEFEEAGKSSETLLRINSSLETIGNAAAGALDQTKNGLEATIEPTNNTAAATANLSEETKKLVEELNKKAEAAQIASEQGISSEAATAQVDYEGEQAKLDEALKAKYITQEQYYADVSVLADEYTKKLNDANQKIIDDEKKKQKEKAQNLSDTLNFISSLSSSKNKELAAIGKAAAITQASIDTYAAANKALSSAPPPINFVLAAAVTAAGLVNVAKIAGFARGVDEVPGVGNRDSFPALLTPGERVVPRETNKDLKEFLQQPQQPQIVLQLTVEGDYFESEQNDLRLLERIQRGLSTTGFRFST